MSAFEEPVVKRRERVPDKLRAAPPERQQGRMEILQVQKETNKMFGAKRKRMMTDALKSTNNALDATRL